MMSLMTGTAFLILAKLTTGLVSKTLALLATILYLPAGLLLALRSMAVSTLTKCNKNCEAEGIEPATLIPRFLYHRIKQKVDELLGAPFQQAKEDNEGLIIEVRSVHIYLQDRVDGYAKAGKAAPRYILEAHTRAEELLMRTEATRQDLEDHEAKLKAFLKATEDKANALAQPLRDHAMIVHLDELSDRAARAENEADELIISTSMEIRQTLSDLTDQCNRLFEQTGLEIAAAQPTVALLAETVGEFVPAEEHLQDKTVH